MDTFRCPTCIAVLTDAAARRCAQCGQRLRRRHPRVLGEETRLGARLLPIDRWMNDRLHAAGTSRRGRDVAPLPWHGRFTATAPAPTTAPSPATTLIPPLAAWPETTTIGALALDARVAPPPDPIAPDPINPDPIEHVRPPVVERAEDLDPEVRALVDELYRQARSEIEPVAAPDHADHADDGDHADHAGDDHEPPASKPRRRWVPAFVADESPRPTPGR